MYSFDLTGNLLIYSKPFQEVILDYDYTFTTPYCGSEPIKINAEVCPSRYLILCIWVILKTRKNVRKKKGEKADQVNTLSPNFFTNLQRVGRLKIFVK